MAWCVAPLSPELWSRRIGTRYIVGLKIYVMIVESYGHPTVGSRRRDTTNYVWSMFWIPKWHTENIHQLSVDSLRRFVYCINCFKGSIKNHTLSQTLLLFEDTNKLYYTQSHKFRPISLEFINIYNSSILHYSNTHDRTISRVKPRTYSFVF